MFPQHALALARQQGPAVRPAPGLDHEAVELGQPRDLAPQLNAVKIWNIPVLILPGAPITRPYGFEFIQGGFPTRNRCRLRAEIDAAAQACSESSGTSSAARRNSLPPRGTRRSADSRRWPAEMPLLPVRGRRILVRKPRCTKAPKGRRETFLSYNCRD